MPLIRSLDPSQAQRTLLAKLAGTPDRAGVIDKARQIATNIGARPYHVFLVWCRWSGEVRGEGEEELLARFELLPTPKVEDLTALARSASSAGVYPEGSIRVTEISAGRHREDVLTGLTIPPQFTPRDRQDDFFYEVVEDGRNVPVGTRVERKRFRLFAGPHLSACCTQYSLVLARAGKDPTREGTPSATLIDGDLR